MDLAKQNTFNWNLTGRFISRLFLLPGVWLIYYLRVIKPYATLADFQGYRNKFYSLFVAVSVLLGFLILTRRGSIVTSQHNSQENNFYSMLSYIIPGIIQGIILVTFSYAIAKFVQDLFNYL